MRGPKGRLGQGARGLGPGPPGKAIRLVQDRVGSKGIARSVSIRIGGRVVERHLGLTRGTRLARNFGTPL